MLFITAGMGGGTGTGAAPVIADIAKSMGILTVAVVTRPFAFEGKRQRVAQAGIEELAKKVDSLIIIPNDKLMEVLGEDVSVLDAYAAANDVLHGAVSGIAEVINNAGPRQRRLRRRAHRDGRGRHGDDGLGDGGRQRPRARGRRSRRCRARCSRTSTCSARAACWSTSPRRPGLKMKEYHEVMNTIKEFTAEDAMVIVGTVIDDTMEDRLRVTMVATGLGGAAAKAQQRPPSITLVDQPAIVARTGTDGMGDRAHQLRRPRPAGGDARGGERGGPRDGTGVRRCRDPGVPAQAGRLTGPGRPGARRGDRRRRERSPPPARRTRAARRASSVVEFMLNR